MSTSPIAPTSALSLLIKLIVLFSLSSSRCTVAFSINNDPQKSNNISKVQLDESHAHWNQQPTRKSFLEKVSATILSTSSALVVTSLKPRVATAQTTPSSSSNNTGDKQYNLSSEAIASIVKSDLTENYFLTNGHLTRSIYDESATFTDEIDTYNLDQWIKGTSQLFVSPTSKGSKSRVNLVGDVMANDKEVVFRFEEDLMFNIPFKPVVFVSGKVILARNEESGLITSYREFWDQDVGTVLKSARFK
mmetsp:Transcript_25089/g.29040  ORF Transcript_25089/g.29040 Transcript_25089/m.29040 type:complete len:248 (-) Transcript_25089:97-840(-)